MPVQPSRIIIFTDLDGSLLDEGYSWRDAEPLLRRIRESGIPLILTTSKTRRETIEIRKEMGIRDPFIVENGAAVFFPSDGLPSHFTFIQLGKTYREIREFVERVRPDVPLTGFGDLTVEEVSRWTGLPPERAALAKDREFTEPFLLKNPEMLPILQGLAAGEGLKITTGGRFHHLIGVGQDKGLAVEKTIRFFSSPQGESPLTIGVGDSENDFTMLASVEIPILIPRPDGFAELRIPRLHRARFAGSRGWSEAVGDILEEIGAWAPGKESRCKRE